ncbi:hypothetical protein QTP70_010727 [Hemibagrus guttatus]|uniref:Transposase n=1 Tax=Hemibagrus guttatus TaxID=175788 RepID=A0AAE0Q6B7_9TELE|nr:hypothetical protein QTP70_010727 [Hemibagrus guttatus]
MKVVDHIATTTDCWTARYRSFIGVTAQWIDPESLKRCSAALACRQLGGSHTFDVLASALNTFTLSLKFGGKTVRTTTDNGANFLKAFQVFGEDENSGVSGDDDTGDEEEDQEVGEDVDFVEVSELLNEDDGFEYQLPKHQGCACHLLNLIGTVDATKATSDGGYKKLYHSTFDKCNALWNKCGRSTLAAEIAEDICSIQLLCPNTTKWNSLFLAVERLLRMIGDKGEAAIRGMCTDLNVPMFNPAEIAFLTEYAAVMSPISQATNILQAETNVHMGRLLPTIYLLTTKLECVKLPLKYCKPLVDARGMDYIKQHMEEPTLGDATRSSSSDEDDFFSALQTSPAQDSSKQLDGYLSCVADHTDLLKSFPDVCKLSVKLNTPLPASVTCERQCWVLVTKAHVIDRSQRVITGYRQLYNPIQLSGYSSISPSNLLPDHGVRGGAQHLLQQIREDEQLVIQTAITSLVTMVTADMNTNAGQLTGQVT